MGTIEANGVAAAQLAGLRNEEAEQALLSAVMAKRDAVWRAQGRVSPEDFAVPIHGAIYGAALDLAQTGQLADPITLALRFGDHPDLAAVGGRGYLNDLAASIIAVDYVGDYAGQIRDLAQRRRIVEAAHKLIADATDWESTRSLADVVGEARDVIDGMSIASRRARTRREVAHAALEQLGRGTRYVRTGLGRLDRAMLGGLWAGRSYAFEAMDKRGKTALAGTISEHLARTGEPHAYVAMEMGGTDIELRHAARALNVPGHAILGNVNGFMPRLAEYANKAPETTIYIDLPGGTFRDLRSEVGSARARFGIHGFILDYWQLVGGAERGQPLEAHLRAVAQWCADYSRRTGMWSLVLAQLNDDGYGFGSRRGLQMACDQVYVLHRDPDTNTAWLEMRASRYTALSNLGSAANPTLELHPQGPYFADLDPMPDAAAMFDDR